MMPGRERPVELSLDQRAKPESMPTTPTLTFSPMQILTHTTSTYIHNKKKNTHYGFSSWFGLASAMGETHWPVSIGGVGTAVVGSVISLGTDVCTTVVFLLI